MWFSQVGAVPPGTLGLLAVLVTVVGLYGAMSYSVTQLTREMGIHPSTVEGLSHAVS